MNHKEVAERILKAVGQDNIKAAAHCATRLRLVVKDRSQINQKALDDDPDVTGTRYTDGQYQIIIGPGDVNKVYDAFVNITGVREVTADQAAEEGTAGHKNPFMAVIKVLSDIFVPLIPALVAGGLLMALNNVLTSKGLFGAQALIQMYPGMKGVAEFVNMLAAAPFTFLPILVGFSATKRFGGNGYLGAAMAAAMVMPALVSGYDVANVMAAGDMTYWHMFGLNVAQAGYQGQVLPILAVAWILAKTEKFLHKHMPQAFDFTFTPLLSILFTGFLTFLVVGPVVRELSDLLTSGIAWMYNTLGGVGAGIFGFFYSPIVISGLHQSFPAIETTLLADIAKTGGDFIFPIACMANTAQGAACLAVFFVTKNQKQKAISTSASVSALLGITEPAIFGVNLPLKFPFFCAMIASGIASVFIGMWHVLSVALGSAGLLGFISMPAKAIPHLLIAIAISFVISFILTFIVGKRKLATTTPDGPVTEDVDASVKEEKDVTLKSETIAAPVSGDYVELKDVKDDVFSTGMMGPGIAIVPSDGKIYAPASGTITSTQSSMHAYGLTTNNGAEILMHIGIDTVQLKGEHFTTNVKQGDCVQQGDILGTFDIEAIKQAGYDTSVMMLVLNHSQYQEVKVTVQEQAIKVGQEVLELEVK